MIIRNEDIMTLITEIPERHEHLRITIILQHGTELVFQKASIANLVRVYTNINTYPSMKKVILTGKSLRTIKKGYAEWQLVGKEQVDPVNASRGILKSKKSILKSFLKERKKTVNNKINSNSPSEGGFTEKLYQTRRQVKRK